MQATTKDKKEVTRLTGIVIELHPKSGEKWSRAKLRLEDRRTVWVTCKFSLALQEVLTADCIYNEKFRSYDVEKLVDGTDENGKVSNAVVTLKLVELLDGVGKAKAARLGESFTNLFQDIQDHPEDVARCCGAKLEDVLAVAASLKQERSNLSRVTALTDLGYPNHLAKQIAPNDQAYRVALESPYAAIRLVSGLGWLIADQVGRKMGILADNSKRIQAGIDHYYYEEVASDGHTRVLGDALMCSEALPSMLGIPKRKIEEEVDKVLIPLGDGWYTSAHHRVNAETIAGFFYGRGE